MTSLMPLVPMAHAVPAPGRALGPAGDAYVASLLVDIFVDDTKVATLPGETFEQLMTAAQVRHLAFHPRTRGLIGGMMKALSLNTRIERNWSSIDSFASENPELATIANQLVADLALGSVVLWSQAN